MSKSRISRSRPSQRKFRKDAKSKKLSPGASSAKGPAVPTVNRLQKPNGSAQNLSQLAEGVRDRHQTAPSSVLIKEKILTKWDPMSALHREMLATYTRARDTIQSAGGKDTEFFDVLSSMLETADSDVSRTAAAALLTVYADRIPHTVLREKFPWITTMCIHLIEHYVTSAHILLIQNLLSLMASCLKTLELAAWHESSTTEILGFMLPFIIHSKVPLRNHARKAFLSILSGSCVISGPNAPATHPAIPSFTEFCIKVMTTTAATASPTSTPHIFGILKVTLPLSAQPEVKLACEAMLKVMGAGHPTVMRSGLQTLQYLFASKPSPSGTLGPELNVQLINALYDCKPQTQDTGLIDTWLRTMQDALINLQSSSDELFLHNLPKFVGTAVDCWQHGKPQIHHTVMCVSTTLLQQPFQVCLQNEVDPASQTGPCFIAGTRVVEHFERALHYNFASAWDQVLRVCATLFEVLGKWCPAVPLELLRMIAGMHGSRAANNAIIEQAVGAAIGTMGPECVLKTYPLQMAGEEGSQEFSRSWMLPVLRDSIKSTRLAFFTTYFLPLASAFHKWAETADKPSAISKSYELLEKQIWSLLPSFCTDPTDLKEAFPQIAKTLGCHLVNRPDLRLDIMSALRHLINTSGENEGNVEELQKYSKNFLPILFNIYTTELTSSGGEGIRLAAYDTIKVFVGISDDQLCCALFFSASAKFLTGKLSAYTKQAILDLARALACKIKAEHVQRLYMLGKIQLEDPDRWEPKTANYSAVSKICKGSAPAYRVFIREIVPQLHEAQLQTSKNSRSRAQHMACVVRNLGVEHDQMCKKILQDAGRVVRANAAQLQQVAHELVVRVGGALIEWPSGASDEDQVRELVSNLEAYFPGVPHVVSCTILALSTVMTVLTGGYSSCVLYHIKRAVEIVTSSPCRQIVETSLYFVRMLFVILSTKELSEHLEKLVPNLCHLPQDPHKHFRLKLRNIFAEAFRKCGEKSSFSDKNCTLLLPAVFYQKMVSIVNRSEYILQDNCGDRSEEDNAKEPRARHNRRAIPVQIKEQESSKAEAASEILEEISHYKDRKRKAGRDVDAGEGTSKAASTAGPSKKRKVDKASDGDAKKGNLEPYA